MIRQLLGWTKPIRYAIDDFLFRRAGLSAELEKLKDSCKDRPLLIVGNGPSLNKTPLDAFAHIQSIGMNKIDMIFPRVKWRPSLILCINNMVVRQHKEEFSKSDVPIYLSWKSRWFVPKRRSIRYFNLNSSYGFSHDISNTVGAGVTVTYAALQFAHYMGANPVIVVGVDHNFDKSGATNTYEKRKGDDVNHFDPNYFKSGTYWGLPDLDASEHIYELARKAFEGSGRRIVDATIGGKLDIFEKVSIDQAIALATKNGGKPGDATN